MRRSLLVIGLMALLGPAAQVQAAPAYTRTCLELTTARALDTSRVTDGLGLPRDQLKELRARLSSYNSVRNDFTLDGLGLTTAQLAEIKRRLAVQDAENNKYPLGWPCKPFKNPALV